MDCFDELDGSELGTKDYWDKSYEREMKNYQDYGDVGEVWFDEDSQIRIINWIKENDAIIRHDSSILDVGSGNGMFLIELARENYINLTGCDYSAKAVALSVNIAKDQNFDIKYLNLDVLNPDDLIKIDKYDVIHDKGTYDAISLDPDESREKRALYIESMMKIVNDDGYFIITSCNWTEDELIVAMKNKFVKYCTIPTPQFKFGGKTGSVVTSMVLKKDQIN